MAARQIDMVVVALLATACAARRIEPRIRVIPVSVAGATALKTPFDGEGRSGTEVINQFLELAIRGGAKDIADVTIGLAWNGHQCVWTFGPARADDTAAPDEGPTAWLTRLVKETEYGCKSHAVQVLTQPVPSVRGGSDRVSFSDAVLTTQEVCQHLPITHYVTRYRFLLDRSFVPPDLDRIAAWFRTGPLVTRPPICTATEKPLDFVAAQISPR